MTPAPRCGTIGVMLQPAGPTSDEQTLAALKRGDEAAFAALVDRHQSLMLRIASRYVRSRAVAEEVVQETWLGVLDGLDGFEGRSSLKTWIFRVLTNRALTRARREGRVVPSTCMGGDEDGEPAVDADRFLPHGDRLAGHWQSSVADWDSVPDERLVAPETMEQIRDTIAELPECQHHVLVMRDVEGWSAEEVCAALEISEGNQRVLLHRARSKVRRRLETYLDPRLALT